MMMISTGLSLKRLFSAALYDFCSNIPEFIFSPTMWVGGWTEIVRLTLTARGGMLRGRMMSDVQGGGGVFKLQVVVGATSNHLAKNARKNLN